MQQRQWQPAAAGIAACGVFGAAIGVAALTLAADPAGRLLAGVAAVGLLAFTALSWRARPKLAVADHALVIRGWFRVDVLSPADLTLVRVTEFRRIGRTVRLLEIDTVDDRLIVLSRWDLGTDPVDVLDALTEAGFVPSAGRRDD